MHTNSEVMNEIVNELQTTNSRDGFYPIRRMTGENYEFIKGYSMGGDFKFSYDGVINGKRCQIIYWGKPAAPWMPGETQKEYFNYERYKIDNLSDDELRFVIKLIFGDLKNNKDDSRNSPVIKLN